MTIKIALCILVGYLCGSVSTGYLIGRRHHLDIRNYGSGNAGATNAIRTLGKKAGIIVTELYVCRTRRCRAFGT